MWSIVRKCVVMALLVFAAFFLQNNFFAAIHLIDTTPNLLLMLTVVFGLLQGKMTGVLLGFFSGLLFDMFGGTVLGQYALIYSVIGYACGYFTPYFNMDMVTLPMLVCAGGELIYGLYMYITCFLIRGKFHFFFYLRTIMIPELIYTLVMLVITYRFLLFVDSKLEETSKRRSADQFD
jgi:rod shape-determining protein MreD